MQNTLAIILYLIAIIVQCLVYSDSDSLCFENEEEADGSSKIIWPNNDKALIFTIRKNNFPSNVKFHFKSSEEPQIRDLDFHLGIKKPYYQRRYNLTRWDYKTYFSKLEQVRNFSIVRTRNKYTNKSSILFKVTINGKEKKLYGRVEGYAYVTTEGLNDVVFCYTYQK